MKIARTQTYKKALKKLGASDADVAALEHAVAANPEIGDVVPGLHGLRKVRFAMGGRGKRGGGRAIYYTMLADGMIVMMFAYAKADQEDLTSDQKKRLDQLLKEIE